jgi:hypothetical protein
MITINDNFNREEKQKRKSEAKKAKGNSRKFDSFREALARIKMAQADGWYFEAVTLQESILCDRLQSHLVAIDVSLPNPKKITLGKLLNIYSKNKCQTIQTDLYDRLRSWWENRNIVVHEFAKSWPGSPTVEVEDALDRAKETAKNGDKLTKDMLKWHRNQKRINTQG